MAWIEKAFEEQMTPHIDGIYYKLFSNLVDIKRSSRDTQTDEKILFMDRHLAIDTFLSFKDGTVLTLQEKTRQRYYHDTFGADFTFEYYNDPATKDEGEWFKLAAQLYFYGYANGSEDGYYKYWIIDVPKLRLHLKNNIGIQQLESRYLRHNKPPAKASFFAVPFSIISDDCILYASDRPKAIVKIGA